MQMIWSAAQGDVSPPSTLPFFPSLHLALIPPLSLRRNAFCFLLPLSRKSFISLVVCSLAILQLAASVRGKERGCQPVQLNDCHLPFAVPCCSWKLFPYFVK